MSFIGGQNVRCHFCSKTVYAMERMDADGKAFHKTCFKCEHCQCVLKLGNFAAMGGRYFCKPHFKQLFKEKGNYHSGFGDEDAKKKWAPQAVVYGAPGANFMKAGASEWDSRQTKSLRLPRRTDSFEDSPPAARPAAQETNTEASPLSASAGPNASASATAGDFKAPRESLAQLASVGALKSVSQRWSPAASPAERRREAETQRQEEQANKEEEEEQQQQQQAKEEPAAEKASERPSLEELQAELERCRKEVAEERQRLEEDKKALAEEQEALDLKRKAFEEEQNAFEEEKKKWFEAHPYTIETETETAEAKA